MPRIQNPDSDAHFLLSCELKDGRLKCAACGQTATPEKTYGTVLRSVDGAARVLGGVDFYPWFTVAVAICASCRADNVFLRKWAQRPNGAGEKTHWRRRVSPVGRAAKHLPNTPASLVKDYLEACAVLDVSPAASACMSRRCLQGILHAQGYTKRDLYYQIQDLLAEDTPQRALPADLYDTVDAVRKFGNFAAHRVNDQTTLQIIEVEADEAEWCIEIAEQLFEHYYERPARVRARLAEKNSKLAAGKAAAKG